DRLVAAALPGRLRPVAGAHHPVRAARTDRPGAAHRPQAGDPPGSRRGRGGGGPRLGGGGRGVPAMTEILRAEAVSKHFGGLKAVDAVDLTLSHGEILGVIGPNGAGKTTLFSLIAGSIPLSSGTILLEGKVISGQPAYRIVRDGVVRTHQIVRPFGNLNVLENVMVGATYGGGARGHGGGGAALAVPTRGGLRG